MKTKQNDDEILKDIEEYCTTVDFDIGNRRVLGVFKANWEKYYQQAIKEGFKKVRKEAILSERKKILKIISRGTLHSTDKALNDVMTYCKQSEGGELSCRD